jgi:predicted nucleic acid-binding protein
MVIVETTVWVDHFNDVSNSQTEWLRDIGHTEIEIGLTDLILCEVLQGLRDDFRFAQVKRDLLRLPVLSTSGIELAVEAAHNYIALRRRGITVRKTIDGLIATFCIEGGHDLLHNDRDYDGYERHLGLKAIHP